LCEALIAGENKLEVLEIGRNRLENKGAKALAEVLTAKKTFVKLNVQQNGIKKEGIIELLKSIRDNKNLEELYLNDNWVKGEEAMVLLDDIIRACKNLRVLNLSDNNIGDASTKKLFEILEKHGDVLEELYYNYNELEQENVIKECIEIASKLPKLKVLEMEGNGIPKEIIEEYEDELKEKGITYKLRAEDEDEEDDEGEDD